LCNQTCAKALLCRCGAAWQTLHGLALRATWLNQRGARQAWRQTGGAGILASWHQASIRHRSFSLLIPAASRLRSPPERCGSHRPKSAAPRQLSALLQVGVTAHAPTATAGAGHLGPGTLQPWRQRIIAAATPRLPLRRTDEPSSYTDALASLMAACPITSMIKSYKRAIKPISGRFQENPHAALISDHLTSPSLSRAPPTCCAAPRSS